MKFCKNNSNLHAVCESIEAHLDRFIAGLKAEGYAPGSLSTKRAALRRFLQWRRHWKPSGSEPDESQVVQFLAGSSRLGPAHRCLASTALFAFLKYLRGQGVISTSAPVAPESPTSTLKKRYEDFLRNDKGLAESSLRVYLPLVADVLGYLQTYNGGHSVRRLNAEVLRAFLFDRTHGRASEFARLLATSLRSFLRFLHGQGEISHDLTAAIPPVRRWSRPDVPRKLTTEEVDRVLNAPDRNSATGRRDLAILLLLARLGLRASEVLVFLRANAPRVPLAGPASIGHIVRRAMAQAEVERPKQIAAHLFRKVFSLYYICWRMPYFKGNSGCCGSFRGSWRPSRTALAAS